MFLYQIEDKFFPLEKKKLRPCELIIPVTAFFLFHTVKGDERESRRFCSPLLDVKVSRHMYDGNLL